MMSAEFSGFEPMVGEIRALRTFRVTEDGALLPLYRPDPWRDGQNCANCSPAIGVPSSGHRAPDPDCQCGFYAYGTVPAAEHMPNMRYVQAVVSCWGRVVAGTRGLRSEYARIDALWLAPSVPDGLRAAIGRRYPSVRMFADRHAMLTEHPLSRLDSYDGSVPPRHRLAGTFSVGVIVALGVLGLLPLGLLGQQGVLGAAWLTASVSIPALAMWALCCGAGPAGTRTALLLGEALLWLLAPLFGVLGWALRVPLLALAASGLWVALRSRRADYFPIVRAPRTGFRNIAR